MTKEIEWLPTLTGEMLFCSVLGKTLLTFPDGQWLQSLASGSIFDESPFALQQPDMKAGLFLLKEWSRLNRVEMPSELFRELRADYTRLFIGPGQVLAPPWESVFVKEGRMIFQEVTLQVREWYLRYNLQPVRLYTEPDDHIGLELTFLAHLAGLGLAALNKQDDAEFAAVVEAQRGFLSEHLLKWAFIWCDQVGVYCRTDFYRGVALVVRGALAEMAAIFETESPVIVGT